jgi:hypothetical protein
MDRRYFTEAKPPPNLIFTTIQNEKRIHSYYLATAATVGKIRPHPPINFNKV